MKYSDIKWEDEEDVTTPSSPEENESFADMLATNEASASPRQSLRIGAQVNGVILSISEQSNSALVQLDPIHTAVIEGTDIRDESGELTHQIGDQVKAYIVSRRNGDILISTSLSHSNQGLQDIQLAQQNQVPVNGKVTGENKGGFEVTVFGKTCFCPISQIDTRFVEDKKTFIGQELQFLVEKVDGGGRNIVVSRAKLLKQEAEQKLEELESKLDSNPILEGTIKDIAEYGAFVDLGGIDGFLHISELSYSRVNKVRDFLDKGDKVRVKVLSIETVKGKRRIALSMKAVESDPWEEMGSSLKEGASYSGKVTRLESFGAFIEVLPGIEGLAHVSELSWEKRVLHPSEVVSVGDKVDVRVLSVDIHKQKISLSLKNVENDPWTAARGIIETNASIEGTVTSLKGFGAIIELTNGVTGLLPMGTLKTAYGESYRKHASPPKKITVLVKEIHDEERKILLTLPNIDQDEDAHSVFEEYKKKQKSQSTQVQKPQQGNFGALLAAKLAERDK